MSQTLEVDSSTEISQLADVRATGRRRFTVGACAGTLVIIPAFLWVLWDLWSGSIHPLRGVGHDNFYELQARAMFHGHLYITDPSMGIEAFLRGGRSYTYFGIFPSLLRMPILLFTSSLDGKLTAPALLLAWIATAAVTALLLWRLRVVMGSGPDVSIAEAVSVSLFLAAVMGGSVVFYLGATPFVFNEDFAWSVPLTLASLFALLGVLERPTTRRVIASGIFILATALDRTPTGYACIIAAFLVAGWFAFGQKGAYRRWALPMVAVGLVPFLANCAVTYAKFGLPIGLPMADQVWTHVNAHRRYFLAANGGKAFSFGFLPSTIWAYFQPFGVRLSGVFPFIMPPGAPAAALGGTVLDQTYPTASVPPTMPLVFLLAVWGLVTAFRPHGPGAVRLTRIVLIGAAAGAGGVLLWGYISQRYIADIMPLLILAGGIGLVDIWRRLAVRPPRARHAAVGVIGLLAAYSVAANIAIAAFPVAAWTPVQAANYVSLASRSSISSYAAAMRRGSSLPYWAPAGTLFDVGNCSGLYLSTGNNLATIPGQQIQHSTWLPVTQNPSFTTGVGFTFNRPEQDFTQPVTLMTYGRASLVLQPDGPGRVRMVLENSGTSIPWPGTVGSILAIDTVGQEYRFLVVTDPNLNSITVSLEGNVDFSHYIAGSGPAEVNVSSSGATATPPAVSVSQYAVAATSTALCKNLARQA